MSANMCSEKQLTILAAYAVKHVQHAIPYNLRSEVDGTFERSPGGYNRTIGRVFSMLVSENLASLASRYPNDSSGATTFDKYYVNGKALQTELPELHIIKLCRHYAYQSCEHDGWLRSDACKLVKAIESRAVQHLPGYDDAPWGV